MVDINSDAYWTTEFNLTEADLDRLVAFIEKSGEAQPLSTLTKRVVNGRLRYGHEESTPISQLFGVETSVKQWDPAADWQIGDHVIVLRTSGKRFVSIIGEIQGIDLDERGAEFGRVDIFIPGEIRPKGYGLMSPENPMRKRILENIKNDITRKREELFGQISEDTTEETVEIIMYEYGERVIGLLLPAIGQDNRFVRLDGRYFLSSLTIQPAESQIHQLAWSLLIETDPIPTTALFTRLSEDGDDGALYGLYLALRENPQWFANTQPGKRPLWTSAGPPPGSFSPQHAAFDPQNYEILCLPAQEAPPEIVSRLWERGLLRAVI